MNFFYILPVSGFLFAFIKKSSFFLVFSSTVTGNYLSNPNNSLS